MTPILAHFGHWYAELLYVVPFVVIVGALKLQARRDRRRERGNPPEADEPHVPGERTADERGGGSELSGPVSSVG